MSWWLVLDVVTMILVIRRVCDSYPNVRLMDRIHLGVTGFRVLMKLIEISAMICMHLSDPSNLK